MSALRHIGAALFGLCVFAVVYAWLILFGVVFGG